MKETNKDKQEAMFAMIKRCQENGISHKQFCRENGIAEAVYYYWQKKYKASQEVTDPKFIPIHLGLSPETNQEMEISYPNGVKLKLPMSTEVNVVRMYLGLV